MADHRVFSGAAGANNGTSWTDAYITFGAAVTAAVANDRIFVHKTHQELLGVATTYTLAANVAVICVDKDAADIPAVMGTGGFISGNNEVLNFAGNSSRFFVYGMTLRVGGGTSRTLVLAGGDGTHAVYERCSIEMNNTASASRIFLGSNMLDQQTAIVLRDCTFTFTTASQRAMCPGRVFIEGGATAGVALTGFLDFDRTDPGGGVFRADGVDFSSMATGSFMVDDATTQAGLAVFARCKMPVGWTLMTTQTEPNLSSVEAWAFDCSAADNHSTIRYETPMGSVVSDGGIYLTAGAAQQAWKITTTAACSYYAPFYTPWIDRRNDALLAITPYLEILRDGSATAFQNDEVWAEFNAKTVVDSVRSDYYGDRMALLGTPADQAAGAGLGAWTGESATAWSGKCDSGAAFTPTEVGAIRGRIVVGEPSITVYVDPQIRT